MPTRLAVSTTLDPGTNDSTTPPSRNAKSEGLLDVGVHAEMAVYTGYGHGIDKPRSQRAVMAHNRVWFGHYIFGEPAPTLSLLGGASNSAQARL